MREKSRESPLKNPSLFQRKKLSNFATPLFFNLSVKLNPFLGSSTKLFFCKDTSPHKKVEKISVTRKFFPSSKKAVDKLPPFKKSSRHGKNLQVHLCNLIFFSESSSGVVNAESEESLAGLFSKMPLGSVHDEVELSLGEILGDFRQLQSFCVGQELTQWNTQGI